MSLLFACLFCCYTWSFGKYDPSSSPLITTSLFQSKFEISIGLGRTIKVQSLTIIDPLYDLCYDFH